MGTRWKIEFLARLPSAPEEEQWTVGIAPHKFETLRSRGHKVKLSRVLLIGEVFENTRAIRRGWSRPDTDECFVYVGKPGCDYRGAAIEVPPPPNMLFLVFVLPDGTIDEWTWRKASEEDPLQPEGLDSEVLWQQK